jgi:preprotein translocase subunit YajC
MNSDNKLIQSLETSGEVDYLLILISLFFCIVSSFILMFVYKNKANSLSSKIQISMIIPLLSNITFLVILIVKSSLALSLGLVGALSVIRFRTPIKEPEDLAFLFFAIALGIGYGAMQIFSTSIIFLILIVVIWFFLSKRDKTNDKNFNLIIETNLEKNDKYFDQILKILKDNAIEAEIVKIEKNESSVNLFYKVSFEQITDLKNIINDLEKEFKGIKFSIYENRTIE